MVPPPGASPVAAVLLLLLPLSLAVTCEPPSSWRPILDPHVRPEGVSVGVAVPNLSPTTSFIARLGGKSVALRGPEAEDCMVRGELALTLQELMAGSCGLTEDAAHYKLRCAVTAERADGIGVPSASYFSVSLRRHLPSRRATRSLPWATTDHTKMSLDADGVAAFSMTVVLNPSTNTAVVAVHNYSARIIDVTRALLFSSSTSPYIDRYNVTVKVNMSNVCQLDSTDYFTLKVTETSDTFLKVSLENGDSICAIDAVDADLFLVSATTGINETDVISKWFFEDQALYVGINVAWSFSKASVSATLDRVVATMANGTSVTVFDGSSWAAALSGSTHTCQTANGTLCYHFNLAGDVFPATVPSTGVTIVTSITVSSVDFSRASPTTTERLSTISSIGVRQKPSVTSRISGAVAMGMGKYVVVQRSPPAYVALLVGAGVAAGSGLLIVAVLAAKLSLRKRSDS